MRLNLQQPAGTSAFGFECTFEANIGPSEAMSPTVTSCAWRATTMILCSESADNRAVRLTSDLRARRACFGVRILREAERLLALPELLADLRQTAARAECTMMSDRKIRLMTFRGPGRSCFEQTRD